MKDWFCSSWWWVFLPPIVIWFVLFFVLQGITPEDPRDGPSGKVATKVEGGLPLRFDQKAEAIAQATAADLVAAALEDAIEILVEKGGSLMDQAAVQLAVDQAVDGAISADSQFEGLDAPSVVTATSDSISEELIELPQAITDKLDTPLDATAEAGLVGDTLDAVLQSIALEGVPPDMNNQPAIEELVFEEATAAVGELDLQAEDEQRLIEGLTSAATTGIGGLQERAADAVVDAAEIQADDADRVSDAVLKDVTGQIEDIVDEVVKSEVDPADTAVVEEIAETLLEDSVQGEASREEAAAIVAQAIGGSGAGVVSAQRRGAGSLSWLRDLLDAGLWRSFIAVPAAWALLIFLAEASWRTRETEAAAAAAAAETFRDTAADAADAAAASAKKAEASREAAADAAARSTSAKDESPPVSGEN